MEKRICRSYNFAVFVVNGDGITLARPGKDDVLIEKEEELKDIILKHVEKHNLTRFPIAITGNICVGRGISMMSEEFIFDFGILSNVTNKDEVSQSAGRLKANMKEWANYKAPVVFTTAKFNKIAREFELQSRALGKLAHDKLLNGEETVVFKNEFKALGKPRAYECLVMYPLTPEAVDIARVRTDCNMRRKDPQGRLKQNLGDMPSGQGGRIYSIRECAERMASRGSSNLKTAYGYALDGSDTSLGVIFRKRIGQRNQQARECWEKVRTDNPAHYEIYQNELRRQQRQQSSA